MSFIAEIKRRKVIRVAGAYLVGAWIVLQVAATLLPALELPSWTVKLVAILIILGFPFALILGWIFDITPGGIERTTDSAPVRFPLRAAIAGTVIVVAGVIGFLVVRRSLNAAGIDPNSVVVLPFRVSGGAELEVMREGMVDLIVPKLTGVGGPRAVDSRTTLSAWRNTVKAEKDDLAPTDAIKLARKLKAAQVILGEVVGAPGAISINARIYSTIDGIASDPARVRTTQDSLLSAVDVLIAELLSRQAGEGERLASLLTSSLPAVQHYLDGNRNYRRGKYEEAAEQFADAVDIDSTFALAAYGEALARSWAGFGPRFVRALQLAFAFKERLPPRERALLIARVGENFPQPRSYSETVRAWEAISTQYPDSPELWYDLGDAYFHAGRPLGMEDYETRALNAWSKAVALDSSYAPPWEHQVQIHAARGDTARLHAVYAHLKSLEGERVRRTVEWVYAVATGNDTMHARQLAEISKWPRSSVPDVVVATMGSGVSPSGLDELVSHLVTSASTDQERASGHTAAASYHLNRGRPGVARKHVETAGRFAGSETNTLATTVVLAIAYPELGGDVGESAVQKLRSKKDPGLLCNVGLWDALAGRHEGVRAAAAVIADSMNNVPQRAGFLRICTQVMLAAEAVVAKKPNASADLQRVDSAILNGPTLGPQAANFLATVLPRLYAQIGDHERARLAAMRGGYTFWGLAPHTLEHARMAARTGRPEEAIKSYRIYLAMRPDPEPGPAKDLTDNARAELAALTSR